MHITIILIVIIVIIIIYYVTKINDNKSPLTPLRQASPLTPLRQASSIKINDNKSSFNKYIGLWVSDEGCKLKITGDGDLYFVEFIATNKYILYDAYDTSPLIIRNNVLDDKRGGYFHTDDGYQLSYVPQKHLKLSIHFKKIKTPETPKEFDSTISFSGSWKNINDDNEIITISKRDGKYYINRYDEYIELDNSYGVEGGDTLVYQPIHLNLIKKYKKVHHD